MSANSQSWPKADRRFVINADGPVSAPPPKKIAYKPGRGERVRFTPRPALCGTVQDVWPTRAYVVWDGQAEVMSCDMEFLAPEHVVEAPVVERPSGQSKPRQRAQRTEITDELKRSILALKAKGLSDRKVAWELKIGKSTVFRVDYAAKHGLKELPR